MPSTPEVGQTDGSALKVVQRKIRRRGVDFDAHGKILRVYYGIDVGVPDGLPALVPTGRWIMFSHPEHAVKFYSFISSFVCRTVRRAGSFSVFDGLAHSLSGH
jgi:hypothetical protein